MLRVSLGSAICWGFGDLANLLGILGLLGSVIYCSGDLVHFVGALGFSKVSDLATQCFLSLSALQCSDTIV